MSDGIIILSPGSCPRGWTWGYWGYPGGQIISFFKHGHVAYQIYGDDEQILGRSKDQILLTCRFQRFLFQTLCVFSQIKIENVLNRIFILLLRSCPGVGLQGAGVVKNFSVEICDGAPLTARSSF